MCAYVISNNGSYNNLACYPPDGRMKSNRQHVIGFAAKPS